MATRDLTWTVAARNQIQTLLLDLLNLYDETPELSGPHPDVDASRRWQLTVGAVFSMWRAVFLVDATETERAIEDDGARRPRVSGAAH
jgi:hypothetical protein